MSVQKILKHQFSKTGGFNNPKELNEYILKQGNTFSSSNLLFVLPEFEVGSTTSHEHKYIIHIFNFLFQPSKSVRQDYSFIGVTSSTTKADMALSILESFAFRIKKILDNYHNEMPQMVLNNLW